MLLSGTVVLVTGSARRLGRCIGLHVAQAGADVAVHCHRALEQAHETAASIRNAGRRCQIFSADLADPQQTRQLVDQVIESLGRIDVLVNNAAIFEADDPNQVDPALWQRVMHVNAIAPAILSAAAYNHLRQRRAMGKIVNICDIAAERPWGRYQAYCASKAALLALTRSMARAMAPLVQVNAVSPGVADWAETIDPARRQAVLNRIPLGRAGRPEDVAAAVLFLLQDGDYITGEVIRVDGGRSIA